MKIVNAMILCRANENEALIPEQWAAIALGVLTSNMVMGGLVNRDYSSSVAQHGDVVNAHRPNDFIAERKTDADNVTVQDAKVTNVRVPLDQHLHVSFVIKDGERSKSFVDLVNLYLEPAARELAEKVDQVLCGQASRLTHVVGRLGEMDKNNADEFILDVSTAMNVNRVKRSGRNLVLGPQAQRHALGADLFVSSEKRGSSEALKSASLGQVYGLDTYMDQNVSYVRSDGTDHTAGTVTSATPSGETGSITVSITGHEVVVGEYVVVEGDGNPYVVSAATVGGGNTTAVTVIGGTKADIAGSAVITAYHSSDVSGSFAKDYAKRIVIDGQTAGKEVQIGQWLATGVGATRRVYTVIAAEVTSAGVSSVLLDRPLELALADNDLCFAGPSGGFNMGFVRSAIALVSRPLQEVSASHGASSAVASFDDLSIRVCMQYDIKSQGTQVTFDLLCGVAILDDRQAVILLS